jgi:hypothetical protein
MSQTVVIILIVIAVLVLGLIAFLIIRRQRYVRALRGRGWTFESRPSLESVLDHHAPPFGLGFVRKVDEAISGQTAGGVPFRVFEYESSEGGAKFDDRVASMQLPLPLPDLFLSTDQARGGVELPLLRSIRAFNTRQRLRICPNRALQSSARCDYRVQQCREQGRSEYRRATAGRRRRTERPGAAADLSRAARGRRPGDRPDEAQAVPGHAAACRIRLLWPSRLAVDQPG